MTFEKAPWIIQMCWGAVLFGLQALSWKLHGSSDAGLAHIARSARSDHVEIDVIRKLVKFIKLEEEKWAVIKKIFNHWRLIQDNKDPDWGLFGFDLIVLIKRDSVDLMDYIICRWSLSN